MVKKTLFYVGLVCVAVIFVLGFNWVSNINKFKDIDSNIKNIILSSLDIQYNHKKIGLDKVFTSEFIDKIDEYFYKQDKRPYRILEMKKIDEMTFDIRIKDKDGEYIQETHFIKKGSKYFVGKILYDI